MPQSKKKLDFSDLGAKVIDFSDLGATPAGGGLSPDQIAARKSDLEKKGLIGPQYANPKGVDTTAGSLVPNALGTIKRGTDVVGDLLAGVGSEVFNLGLQGSRLANVVSGGRVGVPTSTTLEDIGMAPENATQKVGQAAAQIGEFLLPAGAVARGGKAIEAATAGMKAAPILNTLGTSVLSGLAAGGVTAAQTGDLNTAAKAGAGAAAIGAILPAAMAGAKKITMSVPKINSWLGISANDVSFGANPAKQLVDEGLLGATKKSTLANVSGALKEAGMDLRSALGAADATGANVPAESIVINSLNAATKTIGRSKDATFQAHLTNVLDDIMAKHPRLSDQMLPSDAHALKVDIGDAIKWAGAPYEADLNQALTSIYRGLNDSLKRSAAAIGPSQERWGNLYLAAKALRAGMNKDLVGKGTGSLAGVIARDVTKKAAIAGTAGLGAYELNKLANMVTGK